MISDNKKMDKHTHLTFRSEVKASDGDQVKLLLESTRFFYDYEIEVAIELVEERLAKGIKSGYYFIFAEKQGRLAGYTCYGPIACTESSYDLYWIGVHADFQRQGMGKILMQKTEKAILKMKGRQVYIETASRDLYKPTQHFYLACGYTLEAVLKDFYAPGDDKLVYVKKIYI